MESLASVRPKLRHDAVFLEGREGAYVRNADAAFMIKGGSAYRWLSALAPHMTGEHSVEELTDGLGPEQVQMVSNIVGALLTRGLVRDGQHAGEAELSQAVRTRFQPQISFLDHLGNGSVDQFAAFRNSRILVVGDGDVLRSAGEGLVRNGLARLAVGATHGADAVTATLGAIAAEIQADTEQCEVVPVADVGAVDAGDYDLVAYCGQRGDLRTAARLQQQCRAVGVDFIACVPVGGVAVIGPLVTGQAGPCWTCALLRLSDNAVPGAADIWREIALGPASAAARAPVPPTVARMLGNAVAFEVFKHRSGGISSEAVGAVTVQDLETLATTAQVLITHPGCPDCSADPAGGALADGLASLDSLASGEVVEELADEVVYEQCGRLFGGHIGVIAEATDDELSQLPVKVARLRVPFLSPDADPDFCVLGFDVEHVMAARADALRETVEGYALRRANIVGRTTAAAGDLGADGVAPVEPAALATWAGLDAGRPVHDWAPARSLVTGKAHAVPTAAVLTAANATFTEAFERTNAGLASGSSFQATADKAMLSALAYDRIRDLAGGIAAVVVHTPEDLATDEDLTILAKSVSRLGSGARVLEVVGAGTVHVAIAEAHHGGGQDVAAAGWADNLRDAVESALTRLAGRLQCLTEGIAMPGASPALVPDLSLRADLPVAAADASRSTDGAVSADALRASLAEAGRDALIVDLTPPDLREEGVVRVLRVLLTTSGSDAG